LVKPLLSKHVTKFPNTRHYQSWRVVFYVPRYWLQRYDKNHISGTFLPSFFIFSVFSLFTYLSHPLILDLMLLTDAPQPANAMSCCCSVVPALLSILPCRISPRSSASPRRCSPKFAKTSLSEHKNSILQKFTETSFRVLPPASDFRSCRGLFHSFSVTLLMNQRNVYAIFLVYLSRSYSC